MKGLYKRARTGVIKNFTGVSDPYEAPANPELKVETGKKTVDECVQDVIDAMIKDKVITKKPAETAVAKSGVPTCVMVMAAGVVAALGFGLYKHQQS